MFQTFFYFCSTKNQSTWQFFYFHENISRYFFSLGRGNFIKNRLRIEIDSPQYVIQTMPKITQLEVKWEWVGWAANAYFFQILTGENKNIFFGRFTLQFVAKVHIFFKFLLEKIKIYFLVDLLFNLCKIN